MSSRDSRSFLDHIRYELRLVFVLTAIAVLLIGIFSQPRMRSVFEAKFSDSSRGGLAVVPASCPSPAHFPSECGSSCACPSGLVNIGGTCMGKVVFTAADGDSHLWVVPSTWNKNNNTIEVIGGGASGDFSSSQTAEGGGGGAYAKVSNVQVNPGATLYYAVGRGGFLDDTTVGDAYPGEASFVSMQWRAYDSFDGTNLICGVWNDIVCATGGEIASADQNAYGGQAGDSVGTVKYSGGTAMGSFTLLLSSGGGGAGGPGGNGLNGNPLSNTSSPGGAGGGGAGGAGGAQNQAGGSGTEFGGFGSGGGGGANYGNNPAGAGRGGNFGGGGGGSFSSSGYGSGAGAGGVVVITWIPSSPPSCTCPAGQYPVSGSTNCCTPSGINSCSGNNVVNSCGVVIEDCSTLGGTCSNGQCSLVEPVSCTCPGGMTYSGGSCVGETYLTSGTTWSVPMTWNNSNNSIEAIGGGGGGGTANAATGPGGGGGGGAYSKSTNVPLVLGANITYQIGAGGGVGASGGDTWFNGATLGASSVGAKGGTGATNSTGGSGGSSASGVGSTKYSGGNGGTQVNGGGGLGGGGAAGPNGAGRNGAANSSGNYGGGGGGGSGGGTAGSLPSATWNGGVGGNNSSGGGGGAGGGIGAAGATGTNGGGGGGGGGNFGVGGLGGAGGFGQEWDPTHGAGGGAGGGGGINGSSAAGSGNSGGLYGGGGSGGGYSSGTKGTGGVGAQGIIRISWTATSSPVCSCPAGYTLQDGMCTNQCTPDGSYTCTDATHRQDSCGTVTECNVAAGEQCVGAGVCQCVASGALHCSGDQVLDSCNAVQTDCSTTGRSCSAGACICTNGRIWDGSSCSCPAGQVWNGTSCINSCTPIYFCTGNDLYHQDAQCAVTFQQSCGWGCVSGVCNPPPAPGLTFTVSPLLVNSGETVSVVWSAINVTSCTVTGSNGDYWTGTSSTRTSSAITGQTIYTLRCNAFDGTMPAISKTVNIIPEFCEPGAPNC